MTREMLLLSILKRIIKSTPHSMCSDVEAWALAEKELNRSQENPEPVETGCFRATVELIFGDGKHLVAWVDASFSPRVGMEFTGKDGRTGIIIAVFSVVSSSDINRGWKVGGL